MQQCQVRDQFFFAVKFNLFFDHLDIYRYIPTIKEAMKKTKMYEAGLAYVTPTKETFEILKW